MNPSSPESGRPAESIRDQAARWVVRMDRRLSSAESAELDTWLAADPRHVEAFNRSGGAWRKFRELGAAVRHAPAPVPVRRVWNSPAWAGLAAAAVLALAAIYFSPHPELQSPGVSLVTSTARAPLSRQLPDGSVAHLKDDSEIVEAFTATERRIRLVRGEAYFAVTKDAARPFVVQMGDITVRAVGTAFSIRYAVNNVDVWVTEGTVQVTPPTLPGQVVASGERRDAALVSAGHRAVVARVPDPTAPAIIVTVVSPEEIAETLAWNAPMLELSGSPLGQLVSAFSERSGRRIEIADPTLGSVRIGGRFPTDDLDGFIRALVQIYDVKSDTRSDGTIVLSRAGK